MEREKEKDGGDEPEKRKEAMEVDENQCEEETEETQALKETDEGSGDSRGEREEFGEESRKRGRGRGRGRPLKERGSEMPTKKSERPPNKEEEIERGRSEREAKEGRGRRRRRRRLGSIGEAGPEAWAGTRGTCAGHDDGGHVPADGGGGATAVQVHGLGHTHVPRDPVRLVLLGELGCRAISEGTKAVTNYMASESS